MLPVWGNLNLDRILVIGLLMAIIGLGGYAWYLQSKSAALRTENEELSKSLAVTIDHIRKSQEITTKRIQEQIKAAADLQEVIKRMRNAPDAWRTDHAPDAVIDGMWDIRNAARP